MRALAITAVLAALTTGCVPRNPAALCADGSVPGDPTTAPVKRVVPGQYVFTVAPGTTPSKLRALIVDLAPQRIQDLGEEELLVVFNDDPGIERLSFRVGDGGIVSIQPNFVYRKASRGAGRVR
jgi:hypothetical protein